MELSQHQEIQWGAKSVLKDLASLIERQDTELSIAKKASALLQQRGYADTWYYDCPALVLLGSRSGLSVSGKSYTPDNTEQVGNFNLVTVDLSPVHGEIWGDCARSFYVEEGKVTDSPIFVEFHEGEKIQDLLHKEFVKYVTPDRTFGDVYGHINSVIESCDFVNLDFHENLGHSIETNLDSRRFIEKGSSVLFGEVDFVTFEPHVSRQEKVWGFKREDIYYFVNNQLVVL